MGMHNKDTQPREVLRLLREHGELYGMQMVRMAGKRPVLGEKTDGQPIFNEDSIYSVLRRLVHMGLIEKVPKWEKDYKTVGHRYRLVEQEEDS